MDVIRIAVQRLERHGIRRIEAPSLHVKNKKFFTFMHADRELLYQRVKFLTTYDRSEITGTSNHGHGFAMSSGASSGD